MNYEICQDYFLSTFENSIDKWDWQTRICFIIRLPFTMDPSFGRSKPSPTFVILLRTFLSPVTSTTLFQDTSSSLMVKLESGGTSSVSVAPFSFCLIPSEKEWLELNICSLVKGEEKRKVKYIYLRHTASKGTSNSTNLHENFTASSAFSPLLIVFTALLMAGQR